MFKKISMYDDKEGVVDPHDEKNPKVFLEISQGDEKLGRVEIELYKNIVPKTAENFRCLCTGEKGEKDGKKLYYKGSIFHRIIKDFMVQGGDIVNGNGTGSICIYGDKFDDENFKLKHDNKYLLSMANSGANTNGSQFFITTSTPHHLDGKHVVFGQVIKGMDIIDKMNIVEVDNEKPKVDVVISDCGEISE